MPNQLVNLGGVDIRAYDNGDGTCSLATATDTTVPPGSTPGETGSSTVTGAQLIQTIPASPGQFSWITGFDVTVGPAAAGATVTLTITGLTNTLSYTVTAVVGDMRVLSIRFPGALRSTAVNTAITVTLPSVGGGAAVNALDVFGYNL